MFDGFIDFFFKKNLHVEKSTNFRETKLFFLFYLISKFSVRFIYEIYTIGDGSTLYELTKYFVITSMLSIEKWLQKSSGGVIFEGSGLSR